MTPIPTQTNQADSRVMHFQLFAKSHIGQRARLDHSNLVFSEAGGASSLAPNMSLTLDRLSDVQRVGAEMKMIRLSVLRWEPL